MSEVVRRDPDLVRLVTEFFSQTFTPDVVTTVENTGFSPGLWSSVEQLGLPLIGIEEDLGGSGGSLLDLLAVGHGAGEYAVPLPLAETSLAAWLLTCAGAPVEPGPMTVITDSTRLRLDGNRLSGTAGDVAWARGATRVVAIVEDGSGSSRVVSVNAADLDIEAGTDLAGMPRDRISAAHVEVQTWAGDITADALLLRGALLRSAQMAGAMTAAFDLTKRYVEQRVQFGRPIGAFQSVQTHIVELAQASASTTLSVDRAGAAALRGPASFEIVAAKSLANRNAGLAVRAAHQAHGAIGMTREYSLQLLSRRLQGWRGDFGDEMTLNMRLGAAMARERGIAAAVTSVGSTVAV
ncbi:acyl-CoA dehydrogenase family protein [Nocardia nova]|uniref:acyl-CoA dehydrogenase family protein n=1 Tax=Nocardia nova TaxID=37330 RepID=UPI000CE9B649|nr:acyl-CoA dehydrogenase family protein [Nocardia nova]PPJ12028.1 acyl-CoA dehydrogenase [Nocardia nova]PPJ16425.1 acyl-CoA dehydrogenase [Nocardia nova]